MIEPLADIAIPPWIAALPKADLHIHAEAGARLQRILARRAGTEPPDMRAAARSLLDEPAGMPRLMRMAVPLPEVEALDAEPEYFLARLVDLLEEEAADGAILVEVRFGRDTILRPDFMALFREAERRIQAQYPRLHAEAIITLLLSYEREHVDHLLTACIRAADDGLAGIDFLSSPYDTEADWTPAHRWAERAAAAGLGITAHAAEFSSANLAAVLRLPGLTRVGHAVYAAQEPPLLEALARSGVTMECPLTCNVVLGAVASYAAHPIRRLIAHGIPVTLNTDDPVRVWTTIGKEYAIAAAMGFTESDLRAFTHAAIRASFTTAARRSALLAELSEG